jgi:hypothetical protein
MIKASENDENSSEREIRVSNRNMTPLPQKMHIISSHLN